MKIERERTVVATAAQAFVLASAMLAGTVAAQDQPGSPATYKELPSEIPAKFEPTRYGFDHDRRDVMIPMRDGVKLHTVILVPKGAKGAPILLTRTPYDANKLTGHAESAHLGPVLRGYDNATEVIVEGGYIRAVQDVRGKHGSEGDYVVNRPLRGPLNPTPVDHATDTYDTIDWLVKNVPECNGRVGILGISYDGFLPLMALVDPHPALKVSVPMNPMVDGWIGDDWFHNGAFRQINVTWIYDQLATRKGDAKWWTTHHDIYDMYMQAGSAGELGRRRGMDQIGFWRKLTEHPAYDPFWREQAVDKLLAKRPLRVPVMVVHSLWDQEDIYGAPAVYRALEPKDADNDKVFLVMGPWHHGQMIEDGSALGALKFHADTAMEFRRDVLAPFLARYLKDDAPKADIAPVTAFETGTNRWRRLTAWPPKKEQADGGGPRRLHLRSGLKLSFDEPGTSDAAFEEYVSDPAKPVPFRARPIQPMGYAEGQTWSQWLVDTTSGRRPGGRTSSRSSPTCAEQPAQDRRRSRSRPPRRLHQRERLRLGRQADRCLSRRGRRPGRRDGRLPAPWSRPISSGAGTARTPGRRRPSPRRGSCRTGCALPAHHVFLPGHRIMVGAVELVPAVRPPRPRDLRLPIFWARPQDYARAAAGLPRTGSDELRGTARRPLTPLTAGGRGIRTRRDPWRPGPRGSASRRIAGLEDGIGDGVGLEGQAGSQVFQPRWGPPWGSGVSWRGGTSSGRSVGWTSKSGIRPA
ncbi:MAG: CocE/NonD family hydrolase [Isosphaeraceae bacterium]